MTNSQSKMLPSHELENLLTKKQTRTGKLTSNRRKRLPNLTTNMEYQHLFNFTTQSVTQMTQQYKLPELRNIVKAWNLPCSGTKQVLAQRIIDNINIVRKTQIIQRVFRGHMVRLWLKLKYGSKTDGMPVNDTDFYTMEPINEIEVYQYFHYISTGSNTNYVFSLDSIMNMIVNTQKLENPYTRESMIDGKESLIHILRLTNIINPGYNYSVLHPETLLCKPIQQQQQQQQQIGQVQQHVLIPALPRDPTLDYAARIRSLFAKIDLLGFYTSYQWFNELTGRQMFVFMQKLLHIWNHVPNDQRKRVCPITSAFSATNLGNDSFTILTTRTDFEAMLLRIGETLSTDGLTRDDCYAGASYFLTGLVMVSDSAREALPWLYDNFYTMH